MGSGTTGRCWAMLPPQGRAVVYYGSTWKQQHTFSHSQQSRSCQLDDPYRIQLLSHSPRAPTERVSECHVHHNPLRKRKREKKKTTSDKRQHFKKTYFQELAHKHICKLHHLWPLKHLHYRGRILQLFHLSVNLCHHGDGPWLPVTGGCVSCSLVSCCHLSCVTDGDWQTPQCQTVHIFCGRGLLFLPHKGGDYTVVLAHYFALA